MTYRTSAALVIPLLTLLVGVPLTAGDLEDNCIVGQHPAATLLFPYFEVDADDPAGLTTLIAVTNRSDISPILAHVTLWTDWAIPTASFDLFLEAGDVQTVNLRDIFATGEAPDTGPVPDIFPGCEENVGGFIGDPAVLRDRHAGRESFGFCHASPREDPSRITGYVTVDTVLRCSGQTPASSGYFSGSDRIASTDNFLWGDYFYVRPGEDFAQGEPAVAIVADPDRFGPGDFTFYGRYVGFDGSDARAPLSSEWRTRFLLGGAFDAGTELIVWRDTDDGDALPVACGTTPDWHPLTEDQITAWNESGTESPEGDGTSVFSLATQKVAVAEAFSLPFSFGWLELDLDRANGIPVQAWVVSRASAEGRYSVAHSATRFNDLCDFGRL